MTTYCVVVLGFCFRTIVLNTFILKAQTMSAEKHFVLRIYIERVKSEIVYSSNEQSLLFNPNLFQSYCFKNGSSKFRVLSCICLQFYIKFIDLFTGMPRPRRN